MTKNKDVFKLLVAETTSENSAFYEPAYPTTQNLTKDSIYYKNLSELLEHLHAVVQTLSELALLEDQLNKREQGVMAVAANSVKLIKEVIIEKFGPKPR